MSPVNKPSPYAVHGISHRDRTTVDVSKPRYAQQTRNPQTAWKMDAMGVYIFPECDWYVRGSSKRRERIQAKLNS